MRNIERILEERAGLLDANGRSLKSNLDLDRVAGWIGSGFGPTANVIRIYRQLTKVHWGRKNQAVLLTETEMGLSWVPEEEL